MIRKKDPESGPNLTPMVDVIFQLLIFFMLTMKITVAKDETVVPPITRHGIEFKDSGVPLVVDVNEKGWLSIQGAQLTLAQLTRIIEARQTRLGRFPVMIRADRDTQHHLIKPIMDVCNERNMVKMSFLTTQDTATDRR